MNPFLVMFLVGMLSAGVASMNPRRFKTLLATSIFAILVSGFLLVMHFPGGLG